MVLRTLISPPAANKMCIRDRDNIDNPEKVRQNVIEVALDYLACGIDPSKATIFIQSQIPELCELSFYYMDLVSVSRLQRNPTVKSEIQMRNFEASIPVGFFTYPISQAADITAFRATTVPVGEDQMCIRDRFLACGWRLCRFLSHSRHCLSFLSPFSSDGCFYYSDSYNAVHVYPVHSV